MKLYYMTSREFGLTDLRERRLKISRLSELNDPFELLGVSIGEKKTRRIMQILHDHWSETLGLVCFTDNWQSPLMWAHYAEKHHGMCLGFEVDDGSPDFQKMTYVPTRLRNLLDRKRGIHGLDVEAMHTILTTKAKDWSYEREWRGFTGLQERDENGIAYLDFGEKLRLRDVIVGSRSTLSLTDVAAATGSSPYPVEILKARPAFKSFSIVRNKGVRPVSVFPK